MIGLSFLISFAVIWAVLPFFKVTFVTFFLFPIFVMETALATPYLPFWEVTVMVAVPLDTAVTFPFLSTVATFSSLDFHVTFLLSA